MLQGVAVVGQTDHSLRSKLGRTVLPINIKFLPARGNISDSLQKLGRAIKKAANVRVVKIIKLNDIQVSLMGNDICVKSSFKN